MLAPKLVRLLNVGMNETITRSARIPTVAVLMCTFNGERFLSEQFESLASQAGVSVDIFVSDDGSTDRTISILEGWKSRWPSGTFEIFSGPKNGHSDNFRHLALRATHDADYVAFCDQDDIWHEGKLARAISCIAQHPESARVLYGSRTRIIDEEGHQLGFSRLVRRPPAFRNAIIQNFAGGNTMVFNRSAFDLFVDSIRLTPFVTHDWWSYIIVSGSGGGVYYDKDPHIDYRQHTSNVVGARTWTASALQHTHFILSGKFSMWITANLEALRTCEQLLSRDAKHVLSIVTAIRSASRLRALWLLARSGVYRQTIRGNIALWISVALGKF